MAPPEKIIAEESTIHQYLPQSAPFIMIGKLLEATGSRTVTSLVISEDNIFSQNGFFREPGLIENMAQTAAAGVGFISKQAGKEPPVGFIGGIRNLHIYELPKTDSEIRTEVKLQHEIFDATVVSGKIYLSDRCIAECEMKIFLIKEEKAG